MITQMTTKPSVDPGCPCSLVSHLSCYFQILMQLFGVIIILLIFLSFPVCLFVFNNGFVTSMSKSCSVIAISYVQIYRHPQPWAQKLFVLGSWRKVCSVRGAERAVQLSRLEQESRNCFIALSKFQWDSRWVSLASQHSLFSFIFKENDHILCSISKCFQISLTTIMKGKMY